MSPTLCSILEPTKRAAHSGQLAEQGARSEQDRIPVITRQGRALCVRPLASGDVPLLLDLLASLSKHSAQRRFFRPLASPEAIAQQAARMASGNPLMQVVLAATTGAGRERAVAVAELVHDARNHAVAEIAIVVRDDYQQEGLGRMLLLMLAELACQRGVETIRAEMLADNLAVYRLLRGLGLPITAQIGHGTTTALLKLSRHAPLATNV